MPCMYAVYDILVLRVISYAGVTNMPLPDFIVFITVYVVSRQS